MIALQGLGTIKASLPPLPEDATIKAKNKSIRVALTQNFVILPCGSISWKVTPSDQNLWHGTIPLLDQPTI